MFQCEKCSSIFGGSKAPYECWNCSHTEFRLWRTKPKLIHSSNGINIYKREVIR